MSHIFPVTVNYEDTDMGGIVYHANYLKFIERARSAWVRGLGVDQNALRDRGTVFAVRRIVADFIAPARLDDALEVTTEVQTCTGVRIVLDQTVRHGETVLFRAEVEMVAIDHTTGAVQRLPRALRAAI
ncbi:Acyl-CoA thioester hydrolase YbgC [Rhodobacteraceae bacterium THAF1]|uniref:tol-pal system-associated acyl-CoA thioesterase n=1 Tax=Palleronia sp. THAF1 TaxID=2587842 RepID=UPI000F3DAE80|nr:tol-pal system-associated acyl-CoA thioesterase [Palleronia sp. THAF1]QFU07383.1 Acyl-CoA thioester hydrolase YbgC [Palleronia sp. THAF1]VDC20705.1 Acyl-CoA thioester hydrolase YbgC [Rhodobacteraceae bacterium THAF1]